MSRCSWTGALGECPHPASGTWRWTPDSPFPEPVALGPERELCARHGADFERIGWVRL